MTGFLKNRWRVFVETVEKNIYLTLLVGVGSPVGFLLSVFAFLQRSFLSILLNPPMRWRTQEVIVLAISVLAPNALAFYFGRYLHLRRVNNGPPSVPEPASKYDFISRDNFKWRYNTYSGSVAFQPFCLDNQVELMEEYSRERSYKIYSCPICRQRWRVLEHEIEKSRHEVEKIVAAKVAGHLVDTAK